MKQYSFLQEWRNSSSKHFGRQAAKSIAKANENFDKCDKYIIKSFLDGTYRKGKKHSKEAIRHIYIGKKKALQDKTNWDHITTTKLLDDSRKIVNRKTGVYHDKLI